MRLYLDTEFNGFGGELISMALVGDESEWYQGMVFKDPINPWVQEHVMRHLRNVPLLMPNEFRRLLHEFICQYDNPEIICDWHADAEHFCRMLAGSDYGSSLDYACRITILRTPPGQPISAMPHNALEDARALKRWHQGELRTAV